MPAPHIPAVLFICTGNICRSPTAHALLVHKASAAALAVMVDSAAVSDEERGKPFDRRAAAELQRRGVALHAHRARQVQAADFARFDWIIGMTRAHGDALHRMAPPRPRAQVALMLDFAGGAHGRDVPDPWYGTQADFVHAFDLIEAGVDGLIRTIGPRSPGP